ncbi:hypothetical protein PAXRUDRAFT_28387 [Paxillus rubicundulus Ve08.2h10]|uniref:Uncharacterized protein n=1 Tax=Paxillus rubicundulus Ve08.2h10 TaxID=930991 RepID=A0A0D0D7A3_9AGAM|nr:hypothetical protein PAXRUDRAFT_28387 [Paxillus rubicundulus Ve08.2h10]
MNLNHKQDDHNTFFQINGVWWTELAHLPYFDLVCHTIIDPMHNLLLGITKTQWYMQWILTPALRVSTQTRPHELDLMHKFLTTVPIIWDMFLDEAESNLAMSMKTRTKRQQHYQKEYKVWKQHQEVPEEALLQDYLLNYKELYGLGTMKPKFHWAVHLQQQILDYGPVYNFWAFLSEHLNKVLKGSNLNNWIGGQIEILMMREFVRGSQIDSLARGASATTISPIIKALLECLINDHQEALGTVQDAATERESNGKFKVFYLNHGVPH